MKLLPRFTQTSMDKVYYYHFGPTWYNADGTVFDMQPVSRNEDDTPDGQAELNSTKGKTRNTKSNLKK